jgi:amino acid adenylation domain-containing protein
MSRGGNVADIYPLSPMQEGMLFHTLAAPESGLYLRQLSWPIASALDLEALHRAWSEVVARHPVLRTGFVWEGQDRPLQVVRRQVRVRLERHDLQGLLATEHRRRLAELLENDRRSRFDMAHAPLLRLHVATLGERDHHFIWSYPQLLLDGWSRAQVLREVVALYRAFTQGAELALAPVRPYGEYIAWLGRQERGRAETYWRQALAGMTAPTPLPFLHNPEPGGPDDLGDQSLALSAAATAALRELARAHQLTLNTVVQGAWALLLSRYSGEPEVLFGVTVSGRPAELPGIESMVGLFINTLPMRVRVSPAEPLLPWLRFLQAQQAEMRQLEYSSLVDIQGWSEIGRGARLFETIFVFENYLSEGGTQERDDAWEIGELTSLDRNGYPLTLAVAPGERLRLRAVYESAQIPGTAVLHLLRHWQTLLEGFAARPDQRLAEVQSLGDGERHQLLREWNDTGIPGSGGDSALRRFDAQARRASQRTALAWGEGSLTYGELSLQADRLAQRLRDLGVGPEVVVAVAADRSPAWIAALLAVAKAGGAYLPLDLDYPSERLRYQLEDSEARVLLAASAAAAEWAPSGTLVLSWSEEADPVRAGGAPLLSQEASHETSHLAYLIYTSGSTGRPKGVMVEQRGLANLAAAQALLLEVGQESRVLQLASPSFDASVWEIWMALANGAALCLLERDAALSGPGLAEILRRQGITHLTITPSALSSLPEEDLPDLRVLCVAGEALPTDLARRWSRRGWRLFNAYGPTESTVCATIEAVSAVESHPPIGRPLPALWAHVLGPDLQPVPAGIPGELCLGGPSLARGYIGRPDLTAERFVPDALSGRAGERIYRTGDRVCLLPDGRLDSLGRIDIQLKVRGIRIEPEEIETALRRHPEVREAAVVAVGVDENRRLVACVTPLEVPRAGTLREFLAASLPEPMIPAAFLRLAELPRTPAGKLDRRALARAAAIEEVAEEGADAPRTLVEEVLAGIWEEVLETATPVGVGDDFFERGGHSLLATMVVVRVGEILGVDLPINALFEARTLEALAARIEETLLSPVRLALPIVPAPRDGDLPLSFAQQRLWLLHQMDSPAYNLPVRLRLRGELDPAVLAACLGEVVRRHEVLRTTFGSREGGGIQVIAPPRRIDLPVIDLSGLRGQVREGEARHLASREAGRPIDLARGPMLRVSLLRLAASDHLFLGTLHHIAGDGWSIGILAGELAALYGALAEGRRSSLAEPVVQYADFAHWQREWLQGEVLAELLAYWKGQLGTSPTVLELPTDRPRPTVQTFRGAYRRLELPAGLSQALYALGRTESTTPFMTLLAAFASLLGRYTGQDEIVLGTPIAGRNRAEIQGLIGFFVNTLALRVDLGEDPTFQQLATRVRGVALGAYRHQDLPFERLVEELRPGRDLSRQPLFQLMFVLQNLPRRSFRLPGLELQSFPVEGDKAKFDLTLSLSTGAERISGALSYSTDLFDAVTMERLLAHFQTLLEAAVQAPHSRLSELPVMSDWERQQLLVEWNGRPPVGGIHPVHELFEMQARRAPGAPAVVSPAGQLSYGQLSARVDRLAARLAGQGVTWGVRVALMVERSADMIVALLAILKAGGTYVPLDPSYPRERLAVMVSQSEAELWVSEPALAARLPGGRLPVVLLRGEGEEAPEPGGPALARAALEDSAYLVFTSGSTGLPKGILVSHRALATRALSLAATYGLGPGRRMLQFLSLSFDAIGEEIYPVLVSGAALVMLGDPAQIPAEELLDRAGALGADSFHVPPSYWYQILEHLVAAGREVPEHVELFITGGESSAPEKLAAWRRRTRHPSRFFNAYGPSEATITATVHELPQEAELLEGLSRLPIGRVLPGSSAFVLSEGLRPVPVGVSGELYLGGCLADGYLGQPALTAERFVPDPFGRPGERLYRTGDQARWLPNGTLEYLGRLDFQVKIRGFRIETGEIEAVLASCRGVRQAVVTAVGDDLARALAAYVEPEAGRQLDPAALRAALRERLPEHMVPRTIVILPALPLSPSGKVDRRSLPPAPVTPPDLGLVEDEPASPVAQLVATIWCDVLGVDRVGVSQDFFELGGHSLLAMRVMSRLRQAFGVELALRALFEQPTVAGLAGRVEEALQSAARPEVPPLSRVPRADGEALPLSFAQQRLWFLSQLDPESPAYNVPFAVRLSGDLRPAALAAALSALVRRHEPLRTRFSAAAREPVQVTAAPAPVALAMIDLGYLPPPRREREAERLIAQQGERPFDLERGPVLRAGLLRMGEEHILVLTMHHIVTDGWSFEVLMREMAVLYGALCAGEERPPLPELPLQYADYAVWQRGWLQGEILAREIEHWRTELEGVPPVLELSTDRPRPAMQSLRGAVVKVALPAPLGLQVDLLGRRCGATRFMTLLSAFEVLLWRHSGQRDFAVGTPVSGRNREELEGLIGFFVNTLVLRSDVAGNPTAGELVGLVRDSLLRAHAHQDLPFEKLVEELQPERSLGYSPLFQVMFVLQQRATRRPSLPGIAAQTLKVPGRSARFDLMLTLGGDREELAGTLEYSTDLFDGATVQRLAEQYRRVVEALASDPERRIADLPLLGGAERFQLLVEWNDTRRAENPACCLHELFEAQVARTPDAEAVVAVGERLSYRELDRRAEALARSLRSLGVGPEVRVGVSLERTAALAVGLLGILKAGGAYVPLDPGYPRERLSLLLADSQIAVWVTEARLLGSMPEPGVPIVLLEEDGWTEASGGDPGPRLRVEPGNLAYLIYTSGSTGRPKAVAVEHRSAVARMRWAREAFAPDELAGVLASTSIGFDLSVFELFAPLSWGGKVVLVQSLFELPALPLAGEVRLINTVPSLLSELLRAADLPAAVSVVNLAGEPLPRALVEQLRRQAAAPRVRNLYGPSEDTIYSTGAVVGEGIEGAVPIGRPLPGSFAYVLDLAGDPVPLGAVGELYLGGAGLSRGYLKRPELTAERFVPDALSGDPGGRLYRTGDRVRRLADGSLVFLGRVDHQVKVRGLRVELGEIESALGRHPEVSESVVVARGEGADRELVAYVVGREGRSPSEGELRDFLRSVVPLSLVPSRLVTLAVLPRTPHGKVDRLALPAVARAQPDREVAEDTSANQAVQLVTAIWCDVLNLDQVGPTESFFELGGHSLLATRVISRLRQIFGIELPLRTLFEEPTVAALARRVKEALRSGLTSAVPPLSPVARTGREALPLSFAQQRLWFLDQLEPGGSGFNMPLALRFSGTLDVSTLSRAFDEIVRRHETLRTTFPAVEGQPVQRIAGWRPRGLPVADLTSLPADHRQDASWALISAEAVLPFDLADGPLHRLILLHLAAGEHVLLATFHHSIADGWSLGVLTRELATFYSAFARGQASPLPELSIQYADYARWQREWLQGEALAEELGYWRRRLEGAVPVLDLPTDLPRPSIQGSRGAALSRAIPPALSAAVRQLGRAQGVTSFMLLLAAFQVLLARYSGQDDITIGAPIAGRNRLETEGLIGLFLNVLVLRCDLAGNPRFGELLDQVRDDTLSAYAHQDLPFELLVEELKPERSMSHAPLFQVMFIFQNTPRQHASIPELAITPLKNEKRTTTVDLTLNMGETDGALAAVLEYSTELFVESTAERLLSHLTALLAATVAAPQGRVWELSLLSEAEREQVVVGWNRTRWELPAGGLLDRFSRWAEEQPERVAVDDGRERLSYGDLWRRSERLAAGLRAWGLEPEGVVALLAPRGASFMAVLLAIWKAGGVYLPLDPEYPARRLEEVLAQSRACLVVSAWPSHEALVEALGRLGDRVETISPSVLEEGGARGRAAARPGELAYVIFTSGSTGRPKGAMVEHQGMLNHLWGKVRDLDLSAGDVVAQTASQSFDISVWQLVAALMVGGRVEVVADEEVREPQKLLAAVASRGVTILELVPSMLGFVLEEIERQGESRPPLAALRFVMSTGEALSAELCRRWLATYPRVALINAYGPTECSDDVTHQVIATAPEAGRHRVPIGVTLPNLQLYVVDRGWNVVPDGMSGELWVGGRGVGRGYVGEPGQTAAAFVPDGFSGAPGCRLYRTGDRVRRVEGGALEYLGRLDHQVKLRGIRIELGEIEAVLAAHPAVHECIATVRREPSGDQRLVAYVVEKPSAQMDGELAAGQVTQWQEIYDATYARAAQTADPTLNLAGWISNYTGEPIPEPEMREWVEATVAYILSLRPARVLELGCGSGLLLWRIAPHCARYVGTDLSSQALGTLQRQLAAADGTLPSIEVLHRPADDFSGLPPGGFDLVILNSVAQYFPGIDYLVGVLEGAAAVLAPGGAFFLGDLRSLPLLRAFSTGVEMELAPAAMPVAEIRPRIERRINYEEELLVDPDFFPTFAAHSPAYSRCSVVLKRGEHHNELTGFRYSAILWTAGDAEPAGGEPEWRDWRGEPLSLPELRHLLAAEQPRILGLTGVPNARVARDVAAQKLLADADPPATLGELRLAAVAAVEAMLAVDPEHLWRLGEELGYEVEIGWTGDEDGALDVLFRRPGERAVLGRAAAAVRPWSAYANNPLAGQFARRLAPQLRVFAQERLPEYAVPSAFVPLAALPLTANGKIDRRALEALAPPAPPQSFEPPRGTAEELVCGIWEEVLAVERVGRRENFFELGGHSLLAAQVMSRLRQTFGVELPLSALFEEPTVEGLTATLLASHAGVAAAPLARALRDGRIPLSFGQQRLWFLDQLEPGSRSYNLPLALRITGSLDGHVLEAALGEVIRRHEILRTSFVLVEGQPVQEIAPAVAFDLPVIDLAQLPEAKRLAELDRLRREEALRGFDLRCAPLLRAALLRLAPRDHLGLFTMHHIVSDEWSMRLLQSEVAALYPAFAAGRPSPLPELALQYADYACWQRSWLVGEVLDAHLAYWASQLRGELPVLALPTDYPRPASPGERGAQAAFLLPVQLAQELGRLSRREGVTLFMTLLAGFEVLLNRYTGQQDLIVGTAIAGRDRRETETLIGLFINMLPLRVDLGAVSTFRDLLRKVREVALGAYAHQELPFDKLVQELQPARQGTHTPIFQVAFGLRNVPIEGAHLRGLSMQPQMTEETAVRFDLTLWMSEGPNGLSAVWRYRSDLFARATIARMNEHLQNLLESAAANPDADLADLEMWSEAERERRRREEAAAEEASYRRFKNVERKPAPLPLRGPLAAD